MTPEQWAEIQARDAGVHPFDADSATEDRRLLLAHVRELEALNRGDLIGSVRRLTERCCKPKDERIAALERSETQLISERDNAEEWADKLAYAIGIHLGVEIGEHSNLNEPWAVALSELEDCQP